jgi:hypothetical protein
VEAKKLEALINAGVEPKEAETETKRQLRATAETVEASGAT